MSDRVTEELISAYLDGELSHDERTLVERQLAESEEYQRLFSELQELRSRIKALPSFKLPADFSDRVVARIEQSKPLPSPGTGVKPAADSRSASAWLQLAVAAASLAAVVLAMILWREPTSVQPRPQPPVTAAVLPVFLFEHPQYVVIYDVTMTPRGEKRQTFDKLLRRVGIAVGDPHLRLDPRLEADLLAVRPAEDGDPGGALIPYKKAAPSAGEDHRVEVIYVAGMAGTIDQFGQELERLEKLGEEIAEMRYDMALEPRKVSLLRRLHTTASEHFAQRPAPEPSEAGYAFKLVFSTQLTSASVPGVASFTLPQLTPRFSASPAGQVASSGAATPSPTPPANVAPAAAAPAPQQPDFGSEVGHVLILLRHPAG